ncbi:MAG: hypothetical protein IKZ46_02025 [Victivallales bacterium]|nr:hypothetical protein [Victivallales bacterium]
MKKRIIIPSIQIIARQRLENTGVAEASRLHITSDGGDAFLPPAAVLMAHG